MKKSQLRALQLWHVDKSQTTQMLSSIHLLSCSWCGHWLQRQKMFGGRASWDGTFCLLHNWLSVIMMQGYWLSHKELSKQKSRETKASRFYFLFEKQQQTNYLNFFLQFPRFFFFPLKEKKFSFYFKHELCVLKIYLEFYLWRTYLR